MSIMETNRINFSTVFPAIRRARVSILAIALTYLIAVLIGISMVHMDVPFALDARDNIVAKANSSSDPTSKAMQNGQPLVAALSDFTRNLFFGAIPSTLSGLGVAFPYPEALYRGWVGGIVSVDGNHISRFTQSREAIYYIVTLVLQLIPYSLAGGVGVYLGLAYFRTHSGFRPAKWYELPRPEILDVARIYLIIIPLFFIASLWEFLFR